MNNKAHQIKNNFELLKNKAIIEFLIGNKSLGKETIKSTGAEIDISMPYLKGQQLCDISTRFGLPVTYMWNGTNKSRWEYLRDLLDFCIEKNTVSNLLSLLFSKEQFANKLQGLTISDANFIYGKCLKSAMDHINGMLYFSGYELILHGNLFVINKVDDSVSIDAPAIKGIDRLYIMDISQRAMQDIADGHNDSALTKSRTLLEEVFCYVIEKKGEEPTSSGDIGKLYGQVKSLYSMHQDKTLDKRINGLLSGLEKILSSISEMRNKESDSHGVGCRRIKIDGYHARLFVNAAMTMSEFVLSVSEQH